MALSHSPLLRPYFFASFDAVHVPATSQGVATEPLQELAVSTASGPDPTDLAIAAPEHNSAAPSPEIAIPGAATIAAKPPTAADKGCCSAIDGGECRRQLAMPNSGWAGGVWNE
ncbi:hypothetical protein J3F83DRAFT_715270 [Trichoderma novae-zelandiae]